MDRRSSVNSSLESIIQRYAWNTTARVTQVHDVLDSKKKNTNCVVYDLTYLHEHSWPEVFVSVPPVARTAGAAAGAQDTLIQAVLHKKQHRMFIVLLYLQTLIVFDVGSAPASVGPPQTAGTAPSLHLTRLSSSGMVQ